MSKIKEKDIEEITRKVESVKAEVIRSNRMDEAKYRLKYEACMDALALFDAHFSHVLSSPGGTPPVKQYSTTEHARASENIEILALFDEIMFGPESGQQPRKPPTDLLNDFRNLIRHELGFGQDLPLNRERAWFSKVICEKEVSK